MRYPPRMNRLCILILALAALSACGSTRASTTASQPVTQPTSAPAADASASAPAPDASVVEPSRDASAADAFAADASEDDANEPPDPRLARLRAFADGSTPIAEATDPAHGLTVVRYLEAPPSGQGRETFTSQHHCGAALARELPALRRTLAAIVEQARDTESFDCRGGECVVRGMEYQPAWHVLFLDVQGQPRIEAVMQVSEALMSEAWLSRATAFTERSLAAARARPCPPRRP